MKTCRKCHSAKPCEQFTKRSVSPDGLHTWCKECAGEYWRKYRDKNRPRINARYNARIAKDREKRNALQRTNHWKNREARLSWKRAYYQKNRENMRAYYRKNRERYRVNAKAYYERTRDRARAREREKLYNLTQDQYNAMVFAAHGKCEICREPSARALVVDHCHNTGVVRGVLCGKCNSGLGMFRDSVEALLLAAEYLRDRAAPVHQGVPSLKRGAA